jgi:DNA-directed RNA polymerase specialized sigma24 family protein
MALAWLLTRDPATCEDVVHDAYAAVLARFGSVEQPGAYLRTVIVNGVYARERRGRRERARMELVAVTTPMVTDGPTGGLADAVAGLAIKPRTAVVLRYWAGLTDAEIAEVLRIRPGSARSILSRAITQLRKDIT